MSKAVFLLWILVCALSAVAQETKAPNVTQGSLFARAKEGKVVSECPLNCGLAGKMHDSKLNPRCFVDHRNIAEQPCRRVRPIGSGAVRGFDR